MPSPVELLLRFVACINEANAAGLAALMTEDHCFTDATGGVTEGREKMTGGWKSYFLMVPNYHIEIESTMEQGDAAAAFGSASGAYHGEPEKSWRFPAAFRLVARDGLVAEWRVFADIEPMLQSMGMHRFPVA